LREFENKTLVSGGKEIARADVWFGNAPTVALVAEKDVVVTLPAGAKDNISYTLRYQGPVPAPITKGAHIADLLVENADGLSQTIPLVAGENVSKLSGISKAWAAIKSYVAR